MNYFSNNRPLEQRAFVFSLASGQKKAIRSNGVFLGRLWFWKNGPLERGVPERTGGDVWERYLGLTSVLINFTNRQVFCFGHFPNNSCDDGDDRGSGTEPLVVGAFKMAAPSSPFALLSRWRSRVWSDSSCLSRMERRVQEALVRDHEWKHFCL